MQMKTITIKEQAVCHHKNANEPKGRVNKMHQIQMKRVYEEAAKSDGFRVLVDRLWPRGVKKEDLPYDWWPKDITPSKESRKAFNHEAERMEEFTVAYQSELDDNPFSEEFIAIIKEELKNQPVTFLYAAKNPKINHVVLLKEWAESQL